MQIYPAIDIRGGKAVRLTQGDYEKEEIFSDSPAETAKKFASLGAKCLHVVDLDGAREGVPCNFEIVGTIVKESGLFVEIGGGVRTLERIEEYLSYGAGRVILGSAAAENFALVKDAVKHFADKVAVGADVKNGKIVVHGWRTVTDLDALDFVKRLKSIGVSTVIYTDISRDGMLSGIDTDVYEKLVSCGVNIIASGGITYYSELHRLREIGVYGAVLGKAVYTGALDLKKVLTENGDL